jgi:hypothetical protein
MERLCKLRSVCNKINLKGIEWEGKDKMHLAKFRDYLRAVVNVISNSDNYVITLPTISFSRTTVYVVDF